MADKDIGLDGGLGLITAGQRIGKGLRLACLNQVDGATAEAATGEAGADQAGQILRELDHQIGLDAAAFKVLAVAAVSLGHETADLLEVALEQSLAAGHGAQVFADDMLGAEVRLGLHLVAPLLEIFEGGIAQEGHTATVAIDDGAGSFALGAAGLVNRHPRWSA